jgi:hypothetical protein
VVGPGDETRIYMEDKIQSLKGYWRGDPHVVLSAPGKPSINIQATTNQNGWGSSIYAKSSEKSSSSTPWCKLSLPETPELAGQSLECNIDLDVQYPRAYGSKNFETEQRSMHRSATLHLAPPGAGGRYDAFWWQGTVGGMLLLLVCGQILRASARALERRANPTRLYV